MASECLDFLKTLGLCIGEGLSNIIIPGTNFSVLSLFLGLLLLSFCLRLLFSFFSALNIDGGFSSAAKTGKSYQNYHRRKRESMDRKNAAADKQMKNFGEGNF